MATKAQRTSFIKEIAPYAVEAYKTLGKVYPSICIAMACVEIAYGTSKVMRSHNAFLGQKVGTGKTATKYWSGGFFNAKTSEEYTIGNHTVIRDNFRSYTDIRQGIFNYYELLNTSLYSKVTSGVDYKTQMSQIKACGYMTSSTEVNSVLTIIANNNLTQYDPESSTATASSTTIDIYAIKMWYKKKYNSVKIKELQELLNNAGYPIKVDGLVGNETIGAVLDYQKMHQLAVDGKAGSATYEKLIESAKI